MENFEGYSFTKEIITSTVRLRLLSSGIIHYTYLPNVEINEDEHLQNHNALLELTGNEKKLPILVDSYEFLIISPEARSLVRKLEHQVMLSCRAIVIKTLSQRILANFYIKFHQPLVPTKIFNNHKDALQWIDDQRSIANFKS